MTRPACSRGGEPRIPNAIWARNVLAGKRGASNLISNEINSASIKDPAAMMSQEQNDLITRTGPKDACGKLMRMYWQPAALVDELTGPRPVKAVKLLGEDLVLFRDEQGRHGLIDRHCAHRGADLAFGRLEHGGLRCAFHGWLFDVSGQCLETPAEPKDSVLCKNITQRAYPVVEKSGILWAWLGEGEPPAFPEIDCFVAPDSHTFAFKGHMNCNWLQALEVGIDPSHASFLHRFFEDEDPAAAYGKQFRGASAGSDMPMTKILREYDRPIINVEHTEYGLRLVALRELDDERTHVRVTNQLFPHGFVIPMSTEMTITQWHVPVDDENCYWYAIFTSYSAPVDKNKMRDQRLELYELPDYRSRKNKSNDYGFDPHEQATATYTGMGADINVHDQWAVESMGPIQDRTLEHLGQSDKAIVQYRRLLRQEIEKVASGAKPFMFLDAAHARSIQGPATMDGIGPTRGWETFWMEVDVKRRRGAPWAAPVPAGGNALSFVERHGLWSSEQKEVASRLRNIVEQQKLEVIRLSFPDQHGILRGKTLVASEALRTLESGCSITTTMFAKDTSHRTVFPVFTAGGGFGMKEMEGAADVLMVPDPTTFRVLPWSPTAGWLLCDIHFADGRPIPFATRQIYKSVLDRLGQRGYDFVAGLEVEFHIFKLDDARMAPEDAGQPGQPPSVSLLSHGYQYLTEQRYDQMEPALDIVRRDILALGLPLRSVEVEFGPSQCEFTFQPKKGLEPADNMVLFRSAVKQTARRHGYHATFMCRPKLPNVFASGWHLHQSLVSRDTGENAFMAKHGGEALSRFGRHYLAGLLQRARASAVFATPTI